MVDESICILAAGTASKQVREPGFDGADTLHVQCEKGTDPLSCEGRCSGLAHRRANARVFTSLFMRTWRAYVSSMVIARPGERRKPCGADYEKRRGAPSLMSAAAKRG